ncbi:SAM-dependent methyltransferase [Geobacillus stearothermophilus]|uniref:class I SAM-dependent methyltransferase n=1 Tax=Geobacillus stearothermophilus TaxID=1422 RepID=UPI001F292ACC|nr:SAM-dependent methyltransferase [Geobacillus stearothermophilus]MCK7606884.1 SAM-dependent methyltransferase [Geobacillus stearothermophilus]
MGQLYEQIAAAPGGRVSYADYMNMALYDAQAGYYMRERTKIGRKGDFITNSSFAAVFGKALASFFIRIVERGGLPPAICEWGGGDGRLALAILEEWEKKSPDTYRELSYTIIDQSLFHRQRQRETLRAAADKVEQYDNVSRWLAERGPFSGIVFSNEFFDALPVHVIAKEQGILYECFVAARDGRLVEEKEPLCNLDIARYLAERGLSLAEGQRLEVPLAARSFWLDIGPQFRQAVMVTIDYGYTDEQLRAPARRHGSLRGYFRHRLVPDPLHRPGEMDLTAHVQWDAIRLYARQTGWEEVAFLRQDRFLLAAGLLDEWAVSKSAELFAPPSREDRMLRALVADDGISRFFDVLIGQKGVKLPIPDIWTAPEFLP